jgi:hypothetical protein
VVIPANSKPAWLWWRDRSAQETCLGGFAHRTGVLRKRLRNRVSFEIGVPAIGLSVVDQTRSADYAPPSPESASMSPPGFM